MRSLSFYGQMAQVYWRAALQGFLPLHVAAAYGYGSLLDHWHSIDRSPLTQSDVEGNTAWHWAAAFGQTEILARLGEYSGYATPSSNLQGQSPLHWAALCGQTEAALYLLQHYPSIDHLDSDHCTALEYALAAGHEALARLILEQFVKHPYIKLREGFSPDIRDFLLKQGDDFAPLLRGFLDSLILANDVNILPMLWKGGLNPFSPYICFDLYHGLGEFMVSRISQPDRALEVLLGASTHPWGAGPDALAIIDGIRRPIQDRFTACVKRHDLEGVCELMARYPMLAFSNFQKSSALHIVAKYDTVEILRAVLATQWSSTTAWPNHNTYWRMSLYIEDPKGKTALDYVSPHNKKELYTLLAAEMLVNATYNRVLKQRENMPAPPDIGVSSQGVTPLFALMDKAQHYALRFITHWTSTARNVNCRNTDTLQATPLHALVASHTLLGEQRQLFNPQLEKSQLLIAHLLQQGADPSLEDTEGKTPLMLAASQPELFGVFLDYFLQYDSCPLGAKRTALIASTTSMMHHAFDLSEGLPVGIMQKLSKLAQTVPEMELLLASPLASIVSLASSPPTLMVASTATPSTCAVQVLSEMR